MISAAKTTSSRCSRFVALMRVASTHQILFAEFTRLLNIHSQAPHPLPCSRPYAGGSVACTYRLCVFRSLYSIVILCKQVLCPSTFHNLKARAHFATAPPAAVNPYSDALLAREMLVPPYLSQYFHVRPLFLASTGYQPPASYPRGSGAPPAGIPHFHVPLHHCSQPVHPYGALHALGTSRIRSGTRSSTLSSCAFRSTTMNHPPRLSDRRSPVEFPSPRKNWTVANGVPTKVPLHRSPIY